MPSIQLTRGKPLPYDLVSVKMEDGRFLQHAVIQCCDCTAIAKFPWTDRNNPTLITQKFERSGWTVYQSKARCPEHSEKRKRQQATHARINEMSEIRKSPAIEAIQKEAQKILSVTDQRWMLSFGLVNGVVTPILTPIKDAQEMILGDKVYMVIPR